MAMSAGSRLVVYVLATEALEVVAKASVVLSSIIVVRKILRIRALERSV